MQRISLMAGKAMRETGQALDRMGMRGQDNWVFLEKICRHRPLMNLFDQRPLIHDNVFVAPNATVIGNVNVMDSASIWYGAVVRGDQSPIQIGGFTSIGDRSTILSIATNPTGFAARTFVGNWVTVGQNCVLKGCTVDDYATIGDGSVIQEGAYVESYGQLEAGSVLPVGARVPKGEVYGGNPAAFVRKVLKNDMDTGVAEKAADFNVDLAQRHDAEFLPYGTLYQNKADYTAAK